MIKNARFHQTRLKCRVVFCLLWDQHLEFQRYDGVHEQGCVTIAEPILDFRPQGVVLQGPC